MRQATRRAGGRWAWLVLLGALGSAGPLRAQSAPAARVQASLQRIYGGPVGTDSLVVEARPVLRISRGETLLGFAEVRNVKGKDQPITFLVAVDPQDRLRDVDILVYREPYGGEVAYEPWRRQFRGLRAEDSVRVGHPIRGISGATISVQAVTAGVRQALAELTAWHRAGRLQ